MKIVRLAALLLFCEVTCAASEESQAAQPLVNLSNSDADSISLVNEDSHVLSNPWWQNFEIYGFAAAGYYDTGADATRANGGFEIKEASLFVEATVWENMSAFIELQTNRLGKDDQLFARTGEVYLHIRDLRIANRWTVGFKIGRVDIPFGEEYLWQDAIDNPLITNSASYPYGWDEGILVYGDLGAWSWVVALSDGTDARSQDDNSDKALNFKIGRQWSESMYLSFSAMRNGDAAKSAIEFGGSHFEPVGASHSSSAGTSPSPQAGASLFQVDGKYDLKFSRGRTGYVAFAAGYASQSDAAPGFDRDFRWFSLEPQITIGPRSFLVARYSEIGTYDSAEGYHFDGKTFAGGNGAFGYDTERFRRLAVGAGFRPNPHVVAKFEIGKDWFTLIDASSLANGGHRKFVGAELAVKF